MFPLISPPDPFEPASLIYILLTSPVKFLLYQLHRLLCRLRRHPHSQSPAIRIVCVSDTHTLTTSIPHGDILIHAGDLTNAGTIPEIQAQINWLSALPHPYKIAISGNHDTYMDPRTRPSLPDSGKEGSLDWRDIHYLQHGSITLTVPNAAPQADAEPLLSSTSLTPLVSTPLSPKPRHLHVYGAPQIPQCGPMDVHAFQYPRGLDAWKDTVPANTSILVTHTPPKYHLDLPLPSAYGCEYLLAEVRRVKPSVHIFGHVHWGAGRQVCWWDKGEDAYIRGMERPNGFTRGLLDLPLWLEVVRVILYGIKGFLWNRVWGGREKSTVMVNSAAMKGNTGKLGTSIQVLDI